MPGLLAHEWNAVMEAVEAIKKKGFDAAITRALRKKTPMLLHR